MAKIYYKQVKEGKWKVEDVPSIWRQAVEDMLAADEKAGSK